MPRKASRVGGAKASFPAKAMRLEGAGRRGKPAPAGHAPKNRLKAQKTTRQEAGKESKFEAKEANDYRPKFQSVKSTAEVEVPKALVEQVIGQERAVKIIRKAAMQKRNVLLVGSPGTGKSLLAQAMAELLPVGELEDVLVAANLEDENQPKIKVVAAGEGRKLLQQERMRGAIPGSNNNLLLIAVLFIASFLLLTYGRKQLGDIITAALLIGLLIMGAMVMFASSMGKRGLFTQAFDGVKLLIDNANRKKAPFVEATGTRAGALLGDCRHDPLQSGGLGTPPHMRVEVGMIHRANKGVLFVDEIATLSARSQQELLTAMQEKKYSITGQSEASSGALVKTEPVPTDFILVASGNYQDVNKVHPALRSRIRGYGYEVYMEDSLADTAANRDLLVQFIAQEVAKDGRIPHFDRSAIDEVISEARRRAGRKNRLTARLRELGGLIRAAGDVAREKQLPLVSRGEVVEAKKIAQTLEQQAAQQIIEVRKEYRVFATAGHQIGRVNGMAVMGDSGIILPIVAEVAPAASRDESRIIATGKLGSIAKEAVENVSAIIKKHTGKDTYSFDIHIQFLQTYEGVEGDSASISVATAVISALEGVGVDQSVGMTGSLSVRGEVLPVGGVTQKVEAAVETGLSTVLIPKANLGDLYLDAGKAKKIKVIPVSNIYEVLDHSLKAGSAKERLLSKIRKEFAG